MDWKKCLLLSGQYKIHNKLSAVTFKSSVYWKWEVTVAAFVAKTIYCSEVQSQRLTADKLPCLQLKDLIDHYLNNQGNSQNNSWKKGTTLIIGDLILSGLREYKMPKGKTI